MIVTEPKFENFFFIRHSILLEFPGIIEFNNWCPFWHRMTREVATLADRKLTLKNLILSIFENKELWDH